MPPHPYIHDGIFQASGYHDINAVTWWILKHRGIAVIGPPPDQFDIQVDWERLMVEMHHNLNTYWAGFTTNPRRIAWLLNDYGIQWAVLGVLRQFYTFRERAITSKERCWNIWHLSIHPRSGISSFRKRSISVQEALAHRTVPELCGRSLRGRFCN